MLIRRQRLSPTLSNLRKVVEDKKVVLLDLDGTLYKYDFCHKEALRKAYLIFKKKVENISFKEFYLQYKTARQKVKGNIKNQAASHSRFLYFQNLLEKKFKRTCFKDILLMDKAYWSFFLKRMKPYKWVKPFLRYCNRTKKKVIIVTDFTSRIQFEKIIRLRVNKYIDFIVCSEEVGVEKPSSFIYHFALGKVLSHAKDAVMIGNNKEKDKSKAIESIIIKA